MEVRKRYFYFLFNLYTDQWSTEVKKIVTRIEKEIRKKRFWKNSNFEVPNPAVFCIIFTKNVVTRQTNFKI